MARKTNKASTRYVVRSTKNRINHPRPNRRGWLFLSKRWKNWLQEFPILLADTLHFLLPSSSLQHLFSKKKKRGRPRKKLSYWQIFKAYQATLYLIVGVLCIGVWTFHWWQNGLTERNNQRFLLSQQLAELPQTDLPHPTHIYIQWFVDTNIKDGTVAGNAWTVFERDAVYIVQSARPGQSGNILIYGHNTREVLGNIRALKGYEKIRLTLSDGSERWYQVKRMTQVSPTVIQYLAPTNSEVLTLYTCAGFADAERFVVQAEPILEK